MLNNIERKDLSQRKERRAQEREKLGNNNRL